MASSSCAEDQNTHLTTSPPQLSSSPCLFILQIIITMFKRSLFRQQRAVAQSLSRTAQSQRSGYSSFAATPLRTSPAITQRLGRRWQSTEAEKKADDAAKPDDAAKTEEDPVKKELEAKSKEVIDLKVGSTSQLPTPLTRPGQVPPFSSRLPKPAGSDEA